MQLSDILNQTGGLQSIARELGMREEDAARAASALSPSVLAGLKRQAESHPQGLEGLGGIMNQFGGGGLLDAVLSPTPTDTTPGNNVLGQIFGSKDVSRAVAQDAASQTGLDSSLLKKMLPMLAMVAAGFLSKQHSGNQLAGSSSGGLGDLLGGLLGGGSAGSSAGNLGGIPNQGTQRSALEDIVGSPRV